MRACLCRFESHLIVAIFDDSCLSIHIKGPFLPDPLTAASFESLLLRYRASILAFALDFAFVTPPICGQLRLAFITFLLGSTFL